ncbi:hypothetical protein [Saccharothrix algeriensis]|uniref:Uncharacterized protein n=1 Tax=Saccharothrix algeriensis TaxID=173560 RepID=A0A8T8HUF0_9PSEU|nr:hypothetical protein [Saccharothrix algeriensis]MBM7813289.1 hypothetical protein [Saccharothrix algeriensis]QTR01840.1 hypothetical protein J7S33_21515 [Saccharothrix algeriensis]
MSAETDPKLVEEIDAIGDAVAEATDTAGVALRVSIGGERKGGGGSVPEGGPYQTHSMPGGDPDDPDGGPYQPHEPDPGKTQPLTPTGGPYQSHSAPEAIAAAGAVAAKN